MEVGNLFVASSRSSSLSFIGSNRPLSSQTTAFLHSSLAPHWVQGLVELLISPVPGPLYILSLFEVEDRNKLLQVIKA